MQQSVEESAEGLVAKSSFIISFLETKEELSEHKDRKKEYKADLGDTFDDFDKLSKERLEKLEDSQSSQQLKIDGEQHCDVKKIEALGPLCLFIVSHVICHHMVGEATIDCEHQR